MRPIALAAVRAGLVDQNTVNLFKHWGALPRDMSVEVDDDPTAAIERVQEALEAEGQVRLQSTDLDILHYYLDPENQEKGQLIVVDDELGTKASKTVTYARRVLPGLEQYIIPWVSESVIEVMTNGETHLRRRTENGTVKKHFTEVTEMFFGDFKAFMVCR